MDIFVTVISTVLVFGFLILIHEFGHYIFARIFKVTINEFSIGMGPKLLWYDSKKTKIRYAVGIIPLGGYVAMAGEDGEGGDDPNSFDKKPAWQRLIITVAGATVNLLTGIIAMLIFVSLASVRVGDTTVSEFYDKAEYNLESSSADYGLELGDVIVKVGTKRVSILDELSYEIMRNGNEPIDLTVIRNGEEVALPDVVFPKNLSGGQEFGRMDFKVRAVEKDFGVIMKYTFAKSGLIVRMCWESLYDLIRGRYTLAAVSGPVGLSGAIGDAARDGFSSVLYIIALISINLGVMNLLPIPALDGGRTVCILIEMVTGKKLPPKVEGTINAVGLLLLLGLSVIVMIKDVIQLVI